jgi:hypothetical protein
MSVGAAIFIGILAIFSFIYTVLTIPIYFLVQQPWKVRKKANELKVSRSEGSKDTRGEGENKCEENS